MRSDVWRHVVHAASTERVAAQNPPDAKDRAADEPVCSDRTLRVQAAAGVEPALPAERAAKHEPVRTDRTDRERPNGRAGAPSELAHHQAEPFDSSVVTSPPTPRLEAPSTAARATSPASLCPTSGRTSAHAARRIRRARFRWPAPPIRLLATTASRPDPGARNTTTRRPRITRSPPRMSEISRERTALVRSRRSNGQPRAPFAAPRGEDRTTGARAHPVAEPVHLGATAVVRLERPFALGHES